jgi:hypothetical protein
MMTLVDLSPRSIFDEFDQNFLKFVELVPCKDEQTNC